MPAGGESVIGDQGAFEAAVDRTPDPLRQAIAKALWLCEAGSAVPPQDVESQWARMLKIGPEDDLAGEWGGWAADADAILAIVQPVVAKQAAELSGLRAELERERALKAQVLDIETDIDEAVEEAKRIYDERNQARRELEDVKADRDRLLNQRTEERSKREHGQPAALEVDGDTGAWYIRLRAEPVARTTEQPGPVSVDWSENGQIIGVELLPAQAGTGDTAQPGDNLIERDELANAIAEATGLRGIVWADVSDVADEFVLADALMPYVGLLAATADDYPELPNADFGHEPSQGTKVTLAQAREIGKGILRDAEQRRAHARDNDPDSQEPGQEIPDPWAEPLPSTWVEELPLPEDADRG